MKTEDLIKKYMETRIGLSDETLRDMATKVKKPERPVVKKR